MAVLFIDGMGKEYNIRLTLKNAREIQNKLRVNILKDGMVQFIQDPLLAVQILYYASNAPLDTLSIEEFESGITDSDVIERAVDALVGAIADFTPSRSGQILSLWRKIREESEKARKTLMDGDSSGS